MVVVVVRRRGGEGGCRGCNVTTTPSVVAAVVVDAHVCLLDTLFGVSAGGTPPFTPLLLLPDAVS